MMKEQAKYEALFLAQQFQFTSMIIRFNSVLYRIVYIAFLSSACGQYFPNFGETISNSDPVDSSHYL